MIALLAAQAIHASAREFAQWGREALDEIRADFYLPDRHLYAEDNSKKAPAFNWGCGILLSAFNAGVRVDPKYKPWLREFADAVRFYWRPDGGFDVLPLPKSPDRYYDDNAWMALALMETFEVLGDRKYLDWAEQTVKFTLSGEDDQLGGGVFWREKEKKSKNTCSNGPTAAACARLFQLTRNATYLDEAMRIYNWTQANLEDPKTQLYWDNISIAGKVDHTNWSYNTALMIRAGNLLAKTTGKQEFADDATASTKAASTRWLDASQGLIKDELVFSHLLFEAMIREHSVDPSTYLTGLHGRSRDRNGHYGNRWSDISGESRSKFKMMDQASAARAYFIAAVPNLHE